MTHTLTIPLPCRRLLPLAALVLFVLAGSLLGGQDGAAAQSGGITFGIQPIPGGPGSAGRSGYFNYTLSPGEKVVDQAIVTNEGAEAITLRVYTADGVTASGGGTAFGNAGEQFTGAVAWVSAGASQVTVEPGKQETVGVTISVPADAAPGDHVAGVVVEAAPKAGTGGNLNTQITERAGVAIVIRVPGETRELLTLGEFCFNQETGSRYFEILVHNQGSVLSRGAGRFRLETEPGQAVFERSVELGNVIPTLDTVIRVHSPQDPPPGKYVARITLQLPNGAEVERHTALTVPEKKVNGCAGVSDVNAARDESENDNFAIQAASEIGSHGSWVVAGILSLVGILVWVLVAILWRDRRRRADGANPEGGA